MTGRGGRLRQTMHKGTLVRRRRKVLKWTQPDLAARAHLSVETISRAENHGVGSPATWVDIDAALAEGERAHRALGGGSVLIRHKGDTTSPIRSSRQAGEHVRALEARIRELEEALHEASAERDVFRELLSYFQELAEDVMHDLRLYVSADNDAARTRAAASRKVLGRHRPAHSEDE